METRNSRRSNGPRPHFIAHPPSLRPWDRAPYTFTPVPALPAIPGTSNPARTLSLAGEWRLALHAAASVDPSAALPEIDFDDTIALPAITETARKGPLNPERRLTGLTPVRHIEGAVWYEREFTVPESWNGLRVALDLERTKFAAVWLDGRPLGAQALLCSPHNHGLGMLTPGAHRLALCVDNRRQPVPGDNHQVSEHTQGTA